MEQRSLVRGAALSATMVVALAAAALLVAPPTQGPARVVAPPNVRIRVQVLNATPTRGLARRATVFLRDRGFDVVDVATAAEPRHSTLVIDRSGHPEWAQLVSRALKTGNVESRPDSSRYLDVTVLVGRDWAPPPEPFYP